jgi:nitrite reductase/ring-hydroxylating ferredoxin subunit
MATRAPFLTQPYGAYYHRDIPHEDEELTHVGPGTPCGEYLRRFWQPVALSTRVQEIPLRVRLLGEDLVVFRDQSGQVGCLELHCPHRGTSLEFGLIAEKGIRCCYHGWLMDVNGRILDTPGEPADSTLKDRLWHGAYPTHEYQGMIFAYMGPPDKKPAFPILDTYNQPGCRMVPLIQHFYPCNWLQIQENVMDPAHLEFLHTITGSHFPEELRMHSVLDWMESPSGMICIATRRVDANIWVRINEYIPPNIRQFPAGGPSARQVHVYRARHTHFTVPVDDTTTMFMGFVRLGRGAGGAAWAWLWPDGRPAVRGEAARARGLRCADQHPLGGLPPRLGTPGHYRSWHPHVEEYRQAWHPGRAKRPGPRARAVGRGAGHPYLRQPYRQTGPRGADARG